MSPPERAQLTYLIMMLLMDDEPFKAYIEQLDPDSLVRSLFKKKRKQEEKQGEKKKTKKEKCRRMFPLLFSQAPPHTFFFFFFFLFFFLFFLLLFLSLCSAWNLWAKTPTAAFFGTLLVCALSLFCFHLH